jgi:hypothetical protein
MLKLATAVQYSFARLFAAVFWRIGADLWCMTEQKEVIMMMMVLLLLLLRPQAGVRRTTINIPKSPTDWCINISKSSSGKKSIKMIIRIHKLC